ncbi:hypothetical protein [Williamsia sp.]|uniref:hypothetical protein n=1 Tax=Williamsia sp. TaxID=1872085 RepID=UPI002F9228BE
MHPTVEAGRVGGADESYLLAEDLFGLGAPIQFMWVFDEDPGRAAIVRLRDELSCGRLDRRVLRTRVPFARDRWVRAGVVPGVDFGRAAVPDADIGEWLDERLRESALRPADGHGWKLDAVATDSGKYVVSLLVSHMLSDGQGLYAALAQAHAQVSTSNLPTAVQASGRKGLRADLSDAGGQVRAAGRSLAVIARELWRNRHDAQGKSKEKRSPAGTDARGGPDPTLATVDVDKQQWLDCAAEHGGTSNSLFTALLAGLVQRSGYRTPGSQMKICIAVNRRGDDDDRANASGGVWIRLSGEMNPRRGLAEIRALSKQAFADYANSGSAQVSDNMQAVVRLLPKRLVGKLMQSIPGPDTTVSNLGVVPSTALELGGVTASSFAIRAIMTGRPPEHRRTLGPAVAAWAVDYGDTITITFFGIHPDHFGDNELLREQLGEELTGWGLTYRFW